MFPSLSSVLILFAFGYVLFTAYQFAIIFFPPSCDSTKNPQSVCLYPALPTDTTKFTFELYGKRSDRSAKLEFLFSKKEILLTESFSSTFSVELPIEVVRNVSHYHVAAFLFPHDAEVRSDKTVESNAVITAYRVPGAKIRSLLDGNEAEKEEEEKRKDESDSPATPYIHWRSVLTISALKENFVFDRNAFPKELGHLVRVYPEDKYLPMMTIDTMKFKESELVKVNATDSRALLTIQFEPVSVGQLRLWQILDVSISSLKEFNFDVDEVKRIFSDTNFYLLLVTITVSVFHLVFDFLAFKNDISFWRKVDKNVGLSATAVGWRCVSGIVILLYLMEEKSNFMITAPAGVQLLIDFWKLTKVSRLGRRGGGNNEEERQTRAFDMQGTRYLGCLMLPICIGMTVYSLVYVQHRSWYSWTVNSLANCVYAFGFLFMTPQLFINYKMKSVAHLPWKALTYKALNTFIDDLFAFIIHMPTAHRLACFRDDVIFVIYMYQRWLYPVDKSRTNEFGESFEEKKVTDSNVGDKAKVE